MVAASCVQPQTPTSSRRLAIWFAPSNGSKPMTQHARISTVPAVILGKPCIKGARITVELILRKLSTFTSTIRRFGIDH